MTAESETCATCRHHRGSVGGIGECRALPPDRPRMVQPALMPAGATPPTVMTYRLTADALPACGLFRPAVEPEAPRAETRAEKVERLKREGVTDLAAFKRALDGR